MASGASVALLIVLGAVQGATVPPISPSMRALWRELVPDDRLDTAYAFDSVALELAFIVGPLLAAGLATAWTPLAGMIVSAAFYCVAAIGFATAPASRAWRPEESVERTRAGALRSPGSGRSWWPPPAPPSRSARSRWRSRRSPRNRARAARSVR